MNKYYVYGHYYNGVLFYIGKGIGNRYEAIKSRTQSYFNGCNELGIDIDKIECKILVGDLTGDNALALEAFLIDMYISQGFKLINIREADLLHAEYLKLIAIIYLYTSITYVTYNKYIINISNNT